MSRVKLRFAVEKTDTRDSSRCFSTWLLSAVRELSGKLRPLEGGGEHSNVEVDVHCKHEDSPI